MFIYIYDIYIYIYIYIYKYILELGQYRTKEKAILKCGKDSVNLYALYMNLIIAGRCFAWF